MKLTKRGIEKVAAKSAATPPKRLGQNEGQLKEIALVDLFAGLRTVHIAAPGVGMRISVCHAAEKCPFANALAKKNRIKEKLFKDIREMDDDWAKSFTEEPRRQRLPSP